MHYRISVVAEHIMKALKIKFSLTVSLISGPHLNWSVDRDGKVKLLEVLKTK